MRDRIEEATLAVQQIRRGATLAWAVPRSAGVLKAKPKSHSNPIHESRTRLRVPLLDQTVLSCRGIEDTGRVGLIGLCAGRRLVFQC